MTGIFFGLTYYLSGNPKKVVNLIGKYLTPILLICIVMIFLACIFLEKSPNGEVQYGSIGAAQGAYADIPFFQGMIEGYYALDGPAGLVFAIIIINAVRGFQVHEKEEYHQIHVVLWSRGGTDSFGCVLYADVYRGSDADAIFQRRHTAPCSGK